MKKMKLAVIKSHTQQQKDEIISSKKGNYKNEKKNY